VVKAVEKALQQIRPVQDRNPQQRQGVGVALGRRQAMEDLQTRVIPSSW
jgi:hypothetical protein